MSVAEKCITPYCRKPVHLYVRGVPYCEDCWDKRCKADHERIKVKS